MSCLQETTSNLLSCLQVVQWALFPGSMNIIPVGYWEGDLIMRLSLSYFCACKQILTHILLKTQIQLTGSCPRLNFSGIPTLVCH